MVYSGFLQGGDEFIVKLRAFACFDGAVIGDQGIASFYDMRFDDYWVNDLVSWQCVGADVDVVNHDVWVFGMSSRVKPAMRVWCTGHLRDG